MKNETTTAIETKINKLRREIRKLLNLDNHGGLSRSQTVKLLNLQARLSQLLSRPEGK